MGQGDAVFSPWLAGAGAAQGPRGGARILGLQHRRDSTLPPRAPDALQARLRAVNAHSGHHPWLYFRACSPSEAGSSPVPWC